MSLLQVSPEIRYKDGKAEFVPFIFEYLDDLFEVLEVCVLQLLNEAAIILKTGHS